MASDMAVGGGLTFRQADDVTSGRQCDIVVSAQEAPGLQRLPDDALATMRSTKNKQKPTPWDFHDVGLSADSMVGHSPRPSNKPPFLIQPTLSELRWLVEVMGQLPMDGPDGVPAMIEAVGQLPPGDAGCDVAHGPDGVAVMAGPAVAGAYECRCCVESVRRDGAEVPRRVRRRLSPEVIALVVERYRGGATAAELGAEHGVSKNGILKLLREQGVQIRAKSLPTAVVTQARRLHECGVSMRQVSKQLGVSRTALRRNFREMGVGV